MDASALPRRLSKGERKRLAIDRELAALRVSNYVASTPRVCYCKPPTGSLLAAVSVVLEVDPSAQLLNAAADVLMAQPSHEQCVRNEVAHVDAAAQLAQCKELIALVERNAADMAALDGMLAAFHISS